MKLPHHRFMHMTFLMTNLTPTLIINHFHDICIYHFLIYYKSAINEIPSIAFPRKNCRWRRWRWRITLIRSGCASSTSRRLCAWPLPRNPAPSGSWWSHNEDTQIEDFLATFESFTPVFERILSLEERIWVWKWENEVWNDQAHALSEYILGRSEAQHE